MKYFLIVLLLAGNVHAEVYKSTNANGEVVYSDTRTKGAEKVKLPPLPTYTPPPIKPSAPAAKAAVDPEAYEELVFLKPENEATIRNNLGVVMAALRLKPALNNTFEHRIQFYLDGKAYGKPGGALHATMSGVDRGEHSLSAAVLNADGDTLISAKPVTVFLQRESIYNPNNPNNPNRPKPSPRAN